MGGRLISIWFINARDIGLCFKDWLFAHTLFTIRYLEHHIHGRLFTLTLRTTNAYLCQYR